LTPFLDIFGFLSVLLRGLTLACEALTVGGVGFLLLISGDLAERRFNSRAVRFLRCSSILLVISQLASISANSAILLGSTNMTWLEVAGAGYCIAGIFVILGATTVFLVARMEMAKIMWPMACVLILLGSVMTSHAFGRLEQRWLAATLTLTHQVATAAWIGGMPYLLIALRHCEPADAARVTNRFSRLAMVSVGLLLAAGLGMSQLYIRSAAALGTTYGAMVVAKVSLTAAVLAIGAMNLRIVRAIRAGSPPHLIPLRRFAEVEVGIGFTIIFAAAALTSTPPAIDVRADRVTAREIAKRFAPEWPILRTPPLNQLSPPSPLVSSDPKQVASFVPGAQEPHPDTLGDIAWSEYNHHWAGLIVLVIGILGLGSHRFSWARNWPVAFFGLAIFLLVRADPENWPLGPRSFWESFQVAEVAQHRIFVLLIIIFAVFEWAVQTGRIARGRAGLVFPMVCATGGALLLTHSHSLSNVKQEFLAELSHIPLAILAVIAGWSRWLEIRLPQPRTRLFAWVWPACFVAIGVVLLNYREN
jgi:copper resistance protein D